MHRMQPLYALYAHTLFTLNEDTCASVQTLRNVLSWNAVGNVGAAGVPVFASFSIRCLRACLHSYTVVVLTNQYDPEG